MSTPEDVAEQQRQLSPNVTIHQYMYERYAHMDFVVRQCRRICLLRSPCTDMPGYCPGGLYV
jgi:hypothetical protein